MSLSFATGFLLNSLCCCRESVGGSTKAATLLKLAFVLMSLVMVAGAAAGVGKSKDTLNLIICHSQFQFRDVFLIQELL